MKAYSMDLRERIVAARAAGESVAQVAQRFGVCTKTVYDYCAKARRGALAPRPLPGRVRGIGPEQEPSLIAMVQENADLTLEEMCHLWRERTGVCVPRSTLHDAVRRAGMRFKKNTRRPGA